MSSTENGSVIERVEKFSEKLKEIELVIDPRASSIRYEMPNHDMFDLFSRVHPVTLAELLADAKATYEENRHDPNLRIKLAIKYSALIDRAYTHGVVKHGDGFAKKVKEYEELIEKLKQDLKAMEKDRNAWKKRAEDYERTLRGEPRGSEVGDVEDE